MKEELFTKQHLIEEKANLISINNNPKKKNIPKEVFTILNIQSIKEFSFLMILKAGILLIPGE